MNIGQSEVEIGLPGVVQQLTFHPDDLRRHVLVDDLTHEHFVVCCGNQEIDVFAGDNKGLTVAEIELNDKDEHFDKPAWLGEEVSADARYYNVNLVKHPFKDWS